MMELLLLDLILLATHESVLPLHPQLQIDAYTPIVIVSKRSIEDIIQTELSISMWRKTALLSASISPSQ
jgi:hypothetical protein